MGVDQLLPLGIVGRHAGRELAPVLDVEQHPRHQSRDLRRAALETKRIGLTVVEMINGGHTALSLRPASSKSNSAAPARKTPSDSFMICPSK